MDNKPKISDVEALLLIVVAIIADLMNWVPVLNWLVTLITLAIFQGYFRFKGVQGMYALMGNLAEFIPIVSVLPIITITVIATIWIDRHPTGAAAAAVAVAKKIVPSKKSGVQAKTPAQFPKQIDSIIKEAA